MLYASDQFLKAQNKSTMTFSRKVTLHLVPTLSMKAKDAADKEVEQSLILVICTLLMSRVDKNIHQSKELVFVDASSSIKDLINFCYVYTSSAAGGLPLGIVITSAESADVTQRMTT